jgi:hypothetical protein
MVLPSLKHTIHLGLVTEITNSVQNVECMAVWEVKCYFRLRDAGTEGSELYQYYPKNVLESWEHSVWVQRVGWRTDNVEKERKLL